MMMIVQSEFGESAPEMQEKLVMKPFEKENDLLRWDDVQVEWV